jgi:hypothetical protein
MGISFILNAQVTVITEGKSVVNSITSDWVGVNISRDVPTIFIYRNNSIVSVNSSGYILQAGDESESDQNNNLDGAIISGNKLVWNSNDPESITHGIFTGYNINVWIKYNYLLEVPMSIIRKSNSMTNTVGGVCYNIIVNPVATAIVVKGMNNVYIYNNTIYSERTSSETWRGLIDVYGNDSFSPPKYSTGTIIKNNIFYTKFRIYNISVNEYQCLAGFQSDYNVFYCESGEPIFKYLGELKTFEEWQELGYDTHSVVINPEFKDFVTFVPKIKLEYGIALGTEYKIGLAPTAKWNLLTPDTAHQYKLWQVGAIIYKGDYKDNESSGGFGCSRSY